MKYKQQLVCFLSLIILWLIISHFFLPCSSREAFRGGGRGRWRQRDYPGEYLHYFRRRNWSPSRRPYGWWNMPQFNYWTSYWAPPCSCKRGCTPEGCSYPGSTIDDCVWATDCNCCTFYSFRS